MEFIKQKKESGFTLIESLVAIVILMVVVAAMYFAIVEGLKTTFFTSRHTVATFLARDGLEYVKHAANSNRLNDQAEWLDSLEECLIDITGDERCAVDSGVIDYTSSAAIDSCTSGSCIPLSYNESINQYGYGSGSEWVETRFTREISIEEIFGIDPEHTATPGPPEGIAPRPDSIKITSVVTWQEDGDDQRIELVGYMFDW